MKEGSVIQSFDELFRLAGEGEEGTQRKRNETVHPNSTTHTKESQWILLGLFLFFFFRQNAVGAVDVAETVRRG